jgi:hypothetical protein
MLGFNDLQTGESISMFRETYSLYLQGRRISKAKKEHELLHASSLRNLLFDREDGSGMFLENVGSL